MRDKKEARPGATPGAGKEASHPEMANYSTWPPPLPQLHRDAVSNLVARCNTASRSDRQTICRSIGLKQVSADGRFVCPRCGEPAFDVAPSFKCGACGFHPKRALALVERCLKLERDAARRLLKDVLFVPWGAAR